MQLPAPLQRGILLKRYKRFLADMRLDDGREITAHCANPGSMLGVAVEGAPIWVHEHHNPRRKLAFSWEIVDIAGVLIPVNTSNPNRIAAEAIDAEAIPELAGYPTRRREVNYGGASRIDFLLEGKPRQSACYVEIKNVHLSRTKGLAEFPDSRTARGAKHLDELINVAASGARAVNLFIIQRSDCTRFRAADDLDPAYAAALARAQQAGVELLCYDCEVTRADVTLRNRIDIEL